MAYVTDAAREYAKKQRRIRRAKDEFDIDKRIIELEKQRILEEINNIKFPEVKEEGWPAMGPAEHVDQFVTFSKNDEQYIKYILHLYGSMIMHVEDDVYLMLDGPNTGIESADGTELLVKENVLHRIPKTLAKKYLNQLIESHKGE